MGGPSFSFPLLVTGSIPCGLARVVGSFGLKNLNFEMLCFLRGFVSFVVKLLIYLVSFAISW
jgi:hypothetical protein